METIGNMPKVLKNLESMSLEELVGTLKVHQQELQQDEGLRREKSLALSSQKNKKEQSSRKQVRRSSSKVLKVNDYIIQVCWWNKKS